MDLGMAIMQSDCGVAERLTPRNSIICVMANGKNLRVIKSFTDPTVVRKLRPNELESKDWYPVNSKAIEHAKTK